MEVDYRSAAYSLPRMTAPNEKCSTYRCNDHFSLGSGCFAVGFLKLGLVSIVPLPATDNALAT